MPDFPSALLGHIFHSYRFLISTSIESSWPLVVMNSWNLMPDNYPATPATMEAGQVVVELSLTRDEVRLEQLPRGVSSANGLCL